MNTQPTRDTKFPTATLVFGLILMVIATVSLSKNLLHWSLDTPMLFIGVFALAGIVMIVSGITSALRRSDRGDKIPPPPNPNY